VALCPLRPWQSGHPKFEILYWLNIELCWQCLLHLPEDTYLQISQITIGTVVAAALGWCQSVAGAKRRDHLLALC
jgi:hypothetical protein